LSPSKKAIPLIRSLLHCRRGILTREGQKGYPYKRGTEGVSLQERDRRGVLTREALLYYFMLSFNENNDKKYNLQ
jgi:hypothetical protein